MLLISVFVDQLKFGATLLDFWVRQNDIDKPRSNSRISITTPSQNSIVTVECLVTVIKSGEYVEFYQSVNDGAPEIQAGLYTVRPKTGPVIPSVILTVNRISD